LEFFEPTVLDRVRRYVVQGKRFWSPIIYFEKSPVEINDGYNHDSSRGFFADEGTGIVAIYKSDVDAFGGYDTQLFQERHGFEDTDFFFSARALKLQVARGHEYSIIHVQHERNGWEDNKLTDLTECPDD